MNKDRIEGKIKDVAGSIERKAGEVTGNPKTQVKGAAKQVEGKVQNAVGKVKDAAKEAQKEAQKEASKPPQRVVVEDVDGDEPEVEIRHSRN